MGRDAMQLVDHEYC